VVTLHDDTKQLSNLRYAPTAEHIERELGLLLDGMERSDTLIVAFAGHGVQFQGENKNYFCPSDADLDDKERKRLIPLSDLYDRLDKCQAARKLLLVDACRNDPQSQLSRSRSSVELESITRPQAELVPKGIVALFSCSAGQQSFEYPELKHGVFFYHVLEAWKGGADDGDQELTLDELVAFTRKRTQTFARLNLAASQTPELKGSFSGGSWVLATIPDALQANTVWNTTIEQDGRGFPATITILRRTGERIQGEIQFFNADGEAVLSFDGTVRGKSVVWKTNKNKGSVTYPGNYVATLDGKTVSGTWEVPSVPHGGRFTMTLAE
jgi:hypothetical protein